MNRSPSWPAMFILFLISIVLFPSSSFGAPDNLKITALLIQDRDRLQACKGSFTKATVDYAIWKKGNPRVTGDVDRIAYFDDPCLIKVISNKPLSGTQYLQIKQGNEWVDICSVNFWAKQLSKRDCSQKFDSKENLGKVLGKKTWVCTFRDACIGAFDYGVLNLGRYTQTEGDFCIDTSVRSLELRVRVKSGTKQYVSNSVKFSYVNADKIVYKGGKCVLSASSSGKSPGQGSTSGTTGPSLPLCGLTQIRQHSTLAKEFNEWRSLYLSSIDEVNSAIAGILKARNNGSISAEQEWKKNLNDATSLAKSTSEYAINAQNKLIALMGECKFSYGIVVTEPFGFITTEESVTGYRFPSFPIP